MFDHNDHISEFLHSCKNVPIAFKYKLYANFLRAAELCSIDCKEEYAYAKFATLI